MPDLETFIRDAFDAWVEERHTDRAPDGMWHPSSVSSRCARRTIYTIRGETPSDPTETSQKRTFEIGKEIHRLFQSVRQHHPLVYKAYEEVAIFDDNGGLTVATVGDSDDIVFFTDGDVEVEEYKSRSSNMMRSQKQLEELPEEEHLVQIKAYIRAIRRYGFTDRAGTPHPPIPDLTMGRIIYLGKDTAKIVECRVVYRPEIDDEMLDARLRYLESFRKDPDSLPPRLPLVLKQPKGKKAYHDLDWMCRNASSTCPFFYRCYNEDPDFIPPYEESDANPF